MLAPFASVRTFLELLERRGRGGLGFRVGAKKVGKSVSYIYPESTFERVEWIKMYVKEKKIGGNR